MDVNTLIDNLKKHDQNALRQFVDEYSPLMLKILSSILNIGHEKNYIEDAYNESLMCIWQNINSFDEKSSFKTWVVAITKYRALDLKRRLIKINSSIEVYEELTSTEENIEESYIKSYSKEKTMEILSPLKDIDKDIFYMYYYLGYNAKEIATLLHFSESNVFKRLSRGRKLLKKYYGSLDKLHKVT